MTRGAATLLVHSHNLMLLIPSHSTLSILLTPHEAHEPTPKPITNHERTPDRHIPSYPTLFFAVWCSEHLCHSTKLFLKDSPKDSNVLYIMFFSSPSYFIFARTHARTHESSALAFPVTPMLVLSEEE